MSHSGNILFLGGDDSQREAIQTTLKQACAGHELWTLEEKVEKIRLTLSFNGACVCSFVFRPLPENADDCRKAVVGACGVFLLCQVGPSGEPSQSVSQALEALRQDPASPTVYPLVVMGREPTQMERALLKWGGMGLSLGGSPDAPYGMNALLARCLPWMAMGEAQSLLTVEEVETLWADYCRYGTLKTINNLTVRLKEEGPLSPLDYAWFLPQGTHAVLSGDVRADLMKLLSLLPKSGCGALTVAARKQYVARIDRLELNTFQAREWRTALIEALKGGKFEKKKEKFEKKKEETKASAGPQSAAEKARKIAVYRATHTSYFALSIFVTIFLCLPFGIIGIVMTSQENECLNRGDLTGAERANESARGWCFAGVAIGVLFFVIWFLSRSALA